MIEESMKDYKKSLTKSNKKRQEIIDNAPSAEEQIESDFNHARNGIKESIANASSILDQILALAKDVDSPARMYEVAILANKEVVKASNDLMLLHKKKQDALKPSNGGAGDTPQLSAPNTAINEQNIFVGSTKDLQKLNGKGTIVDIEVEEIKGNDDAST